MRETKNKKGITLISLVITIIVLLILAEISINMITDNNNVINQSVNAKENSIISEEKEFIYISYDVALYNKKGNENEVTDKDLEKEIENNANQEVTVEDIGDNFKIKYELTEHVYYLNKIDDEIYLSEDEIPEYKSSETIKKEEVKKSTNIGKKVNFVSKYSNDLIWRLFYADDEYVYLIASKLGEDGVKEISPQRTAHTTLGYLGLIQWYYENYSGSDAISDEHLRSLNSLWYSSIGDTECETESAKSIAWLMDQNVWSAWKDEDGLAKYVIGGPTLELFVKSFNSTAEINNASEITYSINSDGYTINNKNSKFSNDFNNGIYTSNANEGDYNLFWLSSPRGLPGDTTWEGKAILNISSDTGFYFGANYYGLGVRPIVMIETKDFAKSNLQLTDE